MLTEDYLDAGDGGRAGAGRARAGRNRRRNRPERIGAGRTGAKQRFQRDGRFTGCADCRRGGGMARISGFGVQGGKQANNRHGDRRPLRRLPTAAKNRWAELRKQGANSAPHRKRFRFDRDVRSAAITSVIERTGRQAQVIVPKCWASASRRKVSALQSATGSAPQSRKCVCKAPRPASKTGRRPPANPFFHAIFGIRQT